MLRADVVKSVDVLDQWIMNYKQTFIAHAVWENNVDAVMTSGKLIPAEYQLRKNKYVSCEVGYGSRISYDFTVTSSIFHVMQETKRPLPQRIGIEDEISLSEAREYRLISDQAYELAQRADSVQFNDGNTYTVIKYDHAGQVYIKGIPSFWEHFDQTDYWREVNYYYKHEKTTAKIQIANDMLAPVPIDKRLATIWEKYKSLNVVGDYRKIYRALINARSREIDFSHISYDIRAEYNSICWSYGNVVVLCGDSKSVLSYGNYCLSDRKFNKTNIDDIKFKRGEEVYMLSPIENGGEFFCLDLNRKDVIIIGPQAILAKHKNLNACQDMTIVCFEEMKQDQLDFFEVPPCLRKQVQPEMKKNVIAVNKAGFFAGANQANVGEEAEKNPSLHIRHAM